MHVKAANIGGTAVLGENKRFLKIKEKIESHIKNEENERYEMIKSKDIATITALEVNKKEHKLLRYTNDAVKRTIDIAGGIFGLLILIPVTIIVAIVNLINKENGPIFYSQKRIGKDGKIFRMYKYRTMVVDADKKLKDILEKNPEMRKEWEENRKLKNDPRITKIGNFLRKTSIDEIPQFVNVLTGDLSLVGPRAVVADEIDKFGMYQIDVLSVKPGITGYWAANGRSETSYDERVFMETKYARNWTVWMDIKILFKTVISVIKKEGAM